MRTRYTSVGNSKTLLLFSQLPSAERAAAANSVVLIYASEVVAVTAVSQSNWVHDSRH